MMLSLAVVGCVESEDAGERLSRRLEEGELTTVRSCTCGVQDYGGWERFEDWPAYDECLSQNLAAFEQIEAALGDGRPVNIEWLGPDVRPGMTRAYWFVEATGAGVEYAEAICDTDSCSASDGWREAPFDHLSARRTSVEVTDCSGNSVYRDGFVLEWEGQTLVLWRVFS